MLNTSAIATGESGSVVVSMSAWHAAGRGFDPRSDQACYIRCKNLALNIRDCISVSFGGDTKSCQSVAEISIWRLAIHI